MQVPFGVVVPGRPVRTDWQQISETKFAMNIECAREVNDLVLFLLPGSALPPDCGAVLYWQVQNGEGYEMLGAIANTRPSGVFRTGFAQHEQVLRSVDGIVTLGVSLEKLDTIINLDIAQAGVEDRGEVAKKIAINLFNFMQSFDEASRPGLITVPSNVFERWMKRFEQKYKQDPNFFMGNTS
mmetsp:Transcript_12131/g.15827  ORF Transcript_12131/g.15827 Transcript_12131/m.15827 type:complete len:183 (+) Transcript_12131:201-749(+)